MPEARVEVQMRLNNCVFKCVLCDMWQNIKDGSPYAVQSVVGLMPDNGKIAVALNPVVVCPTCYKDVAWQFEEPSTIVVPEMQPPKDLVKDIFKK